MKLLVLEPTRFYYLNSYKIYYCFLRIDENEETEGNDLFPSYFFTDKTTHIDLMTKPLKKLSLTCFENELLEETIIHSKFYNKCFSNNCLENILSYCEDASLAKGSFIVKHLIQSK